MAYTTAYNPARFQNECRCLECGKVVASMTDEYYSYMSGEIDKGTVWRKWMAMTVAAQKNHDMTRPCYY